MEIMVTVAVVIILLMVAVPNILRSRVVANEGAAIANLKALNTACQSYHIDQQQYPDSLVALGDAQPPYIDKLLAGGERQGYEFKYASSDTDHFSVHANCIHTGLLKGRNFYMDESSIVRFSSADEEAGPEDEIVK